MCKKLMCPYLTTTTIISKDHPPAVKEVQLLADYGTDQQETSALSYGGFTQIQTTSHSVCITTRCAAYRDGGCHYGGA